MTTVPVAEYTRLAAASTGSCPISEAVVALSLLHRLSFHHSFGVCLETWHRGHLHLQLCRRLNQGCPNILMGVSGVSSASLSQPQVIKGSQVFFMICIDLIVVCLSVRNLH